MRQKVLKCQLDDYCCIHWSDHETRLPASPELYFDAFNHSS